MGNSELAAIELWIVPRGAAPPISAPTGSGTHTTPPRSREDVARSFSKFHPVGDLPLDEQSLFRTISFRNLAGGANSDDLLPVMLLQSMCFGLESFLTNYQGDALQRKMAYDAAKRYLEYCKDGTVANYLKQWVGLYEKTKEQPIVLKVCPPRVKVDCPSWSVNEGSPVVFSTDLRTNPNPPFGDPLYNWSVSAGKITAGQGTVAIKVDTSGLGGKSVTATVEFGELDSSCTRTASCTVTISAPPARKFDVYYDISLDDEKARLDKFARELQDQPTAQGYIIAYSARKRN